MRTKKCFLINYFSDVKYTLASSGVSRCLGLAGSTLVSRPLTRSFSEFIIYEDVHYFRDTYSPFTPKWPKESLKFPMMALKRVSGHSQGFWAPVKL